jgi:hypothetical protein
MNHAWALGDPAAGRGTSKSLRYWRMLPISPARSGHLVLSRYQESSPNGCAVSEAVRPVAAFTKTASDDRH